MGKTNTERFHFHNCVVQYEIRLLKRRFGCCYFCYRCLSIGRNSLAFYMKTSEHRAVN